MDTPTKSQIDGNRSKKTQEPAEAGWAMVPPPPLKKSRNTTLISPPRPMLPFYFRNLKENGSSGKQSIIICAPNKFRPSAGSENGLEHKQFGANSV